MGSLRRRAIALLVGDPGVGKTRFADALAERLGLGRAERVQVKSDTKGRDLLYVFSSNAAPFEPEKGYSKFAVYALLNHGGDFTAAARALAAEGYGGQRGQTTTAKKAGAGGPRRRDTRDG